MYTDEGVGGPQLVTPRHRRAPLTRRPYLGLAFEPGRALRIGGERAAAAAAAAAAAVLKVRQKSTSDFSSKIMRLERSS